MPQVDPGVEAKKSKCRIICPREQYGDYRKAGLMRLAVKRSVVFALLPRAYSGCADADSDGTAVAKVLFQGLRPRLTSNEVPAVDKDR
jgi:hypothetical protein